MNQTTILQHVAINYLDKEKADIFFTKILDLKFKKSFSLSHFGQSGREYIVIFILLNL